MTKTNSTQQFFNALGITTNVLDETKGLIELPYINGMMVAVSDDTPSQVKATERFREVSHQTRTLVASCVPLNQSAGTTIIPGVDVRVPVMTIYGGRFEDQWATNGNPITSNRLMVLQKEMEKFSGNSSSKTPYLSWLCKALGVPRPKSLAALQDLVIEAAKHPEAESIPAISQLLVGRGTRYAVLTVAASVELRDTEPVVSENDWIFMDLERLVLSGVTQTQGNVLRKTEQAFQKALTSTPVKKAAASSDTRELAIEMLAV